MSNYEVFTNGYIYGNWVDRFERFIRVMYKSKQLINGKNAYMIEDGIYIKMVLEDNSQGRYYEGKIDLFDPNKWSTYNDATGNYLYTPIYINSLKISDLQEFNNKFNNIRYIKIVNKPNEFLHFNEIEIYDDQNKKINSKASISSVFRDHVANLAIDGKTNTMFHTNNGPNEEILLDLESNKNIRKIIIFNRFDGSWTRLNGATLNLLDTNKNTKHSVSLKDNLVQEIIFKLQEPPKKEEEEKKKVEKKKKEEKEEEKEEKPKEEESSNLILYSSIGGVSSLSCISSVVLIIIIAIFFMNK